MRLNICCILNICTVYFSKIVWYYNYTFAIRYSTIPIQGWDDGWVSESYECVCPLCRLRHLSNACKQVASGPMGELSTNQHGFYEVCEDNRCIHLICHVAGTPLLMCVECMLWLYVSVYKYGDVAFFLHCNLMLYIIRDLGAKWLEHSARWRDLSPSAVVSIMV